MVINEKPFFKTRLYLTVIVTVAIWSLLAWNYLYGGIPSHHLLANKDLPQFSNAWGGLVLPLLTWFLLDRVQKRLTRSMIEPSSIHVLPIDIRYRFAGALLFGVMLSSFFTFGYADIPGYMLEGLFLLALFTPVYRAECLLGFVIGMTFTFGAVLPTLIGSILVLICAVLYLYVRTAVLYVASMFGKQ